MDNLKNNSVIKVIRIAAVLTCYNRKEKTIACVTALQKAATLLTNKVTLNIIVADDNSSDGTSEVLAKNFPQVEVLHGTGALFWNGGMHMAFAKAISDGYDFYLWINDDIDVYEDFLNSMLMVQDEILHELGEYGIVVGSTCNQYNKLSYGGLRVVPGIKAMKTKLVSPEKSSISVDTFNGNCVLIAQSVVNVLGNIDSAFRHKMGDIDYGFRAKKAGIMMRIAPEYIAKCEHDHKIEGSYMDRTQPFKKRWKIITSPKELPLHSWLLFCKRHAGILWPIYWIWPYFKVVVTSIRLKR